MASSFQKAIKQFSEELDSNILHSIIHDNPCSDGLSENAFEGMPQKFRSPPPKPPRRRYSEQLLCSSSETFPLNKRVERNKQCGISSQAVNNSNKSSASLPPNWTTRSNHFPVEDKNSYSSLGEVKKSVLDTSCSNVHCTRKITSLVENFIATDRTLCFENNKRKSQYLLQSKINDAYFLKGQPRNIQECSNDENKVVRSVIQSDQNGTINFKVLHSDCHRRHHSDPALPCFSSTKAENNCDKFTQRSYSSMSFKNVGEQRKKFESSNTCLACKEMQCLQEEINILKKMNDKLWKSLCAVQETLDNIQSASHEKDHISVAEILSDIYYAQKSRDSAMEERIKIVLEDRDAVLLEMDNMVQVLVGSFEDSIWNTDLESPMQNGINTSDKEIQEVLQEMELTENPFKLLQYQRLLLGRIYHCKELKQDYLSHELRLILKERDNLIEKVKKLEEELKDIKLCNDVSHLDNKHWEDSLLNMLCHIIHQRDLLLLKMDNFQNTDLINLRLSKNQKKNAKKHSSSDYESASKCNSLFPKICLPSDVETNSHAHNFGITSEDTKVLKDEIILISSALEVEKEKRERAEAKCQRLERLINVLRKKVDGKNAGIYV